MTEIVSYLKKNNTNLTHFALSILYLNSQTEYFFIAHNFLTVAKAFICSAYLGTLGSSYRHGVER